jgi:predicted nucleic acid-binding protein
MVVFDTSVLVDLFNDALVGERRERLDFLVKTLEEKRERIAIPTPAYTEFLVKAGTAKNSYYQKLETSSVFRIEPFSKRAAIECAELLERALSAKSRREVTKTKFKFDWMIVATAKAHGASCLYCIDADIQRYATTAGVAAVHVDALPLPKGTIPLPLVGGGPTVPP